MGQLTGTVAVVTRASTERGIGNAIAKRFAREGASVFLVAEGTIEQLEKVQGECRSYPEAGHIDFGIFDLAERGVAEQMIEEAGRRFSRIDVLVNNAGIRAGLTPRCS
jgi:NAD(P)-dependent dehydrogenase (short-subunit alcohol dehydrogenase family)